MHPDIEVKKDPDSGHTYYYNKVTAVSAWTLEEATRELGHVAADSAEATTTRRRGLSSAARYEGWLSKRGGDGSWRKSWFIIDESTISLLYVPPQLCTRRRPLAIHTSLTFAPACPRAY
jgi:hypothetical protein